MSKFEDLNNYLFTALERLNNADLKGEKLDAGRSLVRCAYR